MRPITNSERACFQTCERLWQHTYLDRLEGLVPAETLSRGKRIHLVLSEWWRGYVGAIDRTTMPPAEHAMLTGYHARWQRPHLHEVRVNVPFRTMIGGVEVVGELDAIGYDDGGRTIIVEHKTTTSDIDPGSIWWREKVMTDPQPSTYLAAFPDATVLYDVLKVPSQEQAKATPVEDRKYTKPTKKEPVSRLYANQRENDETDSEYVDRILADMADQPGKYFQRAMVVRLESEHAAHAVDTRRVAHRMLPHHMVVDMQLPVHTPRNPRACFTYGRQCDFFGACWEGRSIESYPHRDKNHSEEVLEKWEASR